MIRLVAIGLAIAVGGFLIWKFGGGYDIASTVANSIASSVSVLSESLADAVRTFVYAIVKPITVPMEAFAYALDWLNSFSPIAVIGFVILYFYLITTPLTRTKPKPEIVKLLLAIIVFGIVFGYAYHVVSEIRRRRPMSYEEVAESAYDSVSRNRLPSRDYGYSYSPCRTRTRLRSR